MLAAQGRVTAANFSWTALDVRVGVENQKLNAAIDQEIAQKEPDFRAYLDELQASTREKRGMPLPHLDYVRSRRAEWWAALYGSMPVTLNTPAAWDKCSLADLGVLLR
jgi:hypothetical protein